MVSTSRRSCPLLARTALLGLVLGLAVVAGACGGEPVGRICDLGIENPNENEAVIASPSLDCQSRTCLKVPLQRPAAELPPGSRYPTGNKGLCTAECDADEDCERVPESPCKSGFTCGIATVVGPFCCRKMCICKDYIVLPEGGLPTPQACLEGNPDNACCNLPGRQNNPAYPLCN